MYCCVIFLQRIHGGPPLLGACSARGPKVWKLGLTMQLITSTVKTKYILYFSIMGRKEKRHKRSHTPKKNKLDTSKSRSRHKFRSRNDKFRSKARPDSSDSFSTSDTSSTSSSDYEHQQSRYCKRHGTKHSRLEPIPNLSQVTYGKCLLMNMQRWNISPRFYFIKE